MRYIQQNKGNQQQPNSFNKLFILKQQTHFTKIQNFQSPLKVMVRKKDTSYLIWRCSQFPKLAKLHSTPVKVRL